MELQEFNYLYNTNVSLDVYGCAIIPKNQRLKLIRRFKPYNGDIETFLTDLLN